MNLRNLPIFISVLLFFIGCNNSVSSDKKNEANAEEINKKIQPKVEDNKPSPETFVEQEINYYAPQSGSVYLAWRTDNYSLEEAVNWNDSTKRMNLLLYIPMVAHGDTFKVDLRIPEGSVLQYNFWITKTKQGYYHDFWDSQSSGKITVTDATPIFKNAIYTKAEEKNKSSFLTKGWLLFVLLIVVYGMLYWGQKKWGSENKASSIIEKVVFLGLSLAFFHALARAKIINVGFMNIIYDLRGIPKIIKGSFSDLLFIAGLVIVFILALLWIKNVKIKKIIYGIFIFIALFSTLVAFTNITTVVFLGKPFNYQWLYYSGFLGSNEAKTALSANLSVSIVINLIAFSLSMLILAGILRRVYQLLILNRPLKYITFVFLGLGMMVLSVKALKAEETWIKGQSENAITYMVYSFLTANTNSSFFSAEIPDDMEPFNPAQGTKLETSIVSSKDHNVKNVLFIILESAGASYFDGYGGTYQLSPNLNKYASQALMFDQMYAHAPATNLSLASILGSMYPYLSYKSLTQEAPDVDHPTLSSVLKSEGYRTSFFSSADLRFQNCNQFLANRGFDRVEDFSTIKCSEQFRNVKFKELNGIDDMCLADCLTSWIDEDSTQNFFSMIWTVQGHYPYYFAEKEEDFGVSNFSLNRYLNCMKHNDKLVGKVMQALEDRGLASSTLVVVVGDHGEAFGQHKQYGHGTAIYEENLKVPLYFINSTLFHGERKSDIAGMKDLATTALSVIDIDIPPIWHGRDLLSTNSDEAFFFAPWSDYLFGYRKDNMKFIFNESQNTVEVYDLSTDSNEKINLFQQGMTEEVAEARTRVAAWVQFQDKFVKKLLNQNN
ncbi:MAG: sulfatase-like hydrolase/transferase [Bacteroidota bacterium]|nr:sulfatase-like hydrolase/transferase [Bacteroidota bacterium]